MPSGSPRACVVQHAAGETPCHQSQCPPSCPRPGCAPPAARPAFQGQAQQAHPCLVGPQQEAAVLPGRQKACHHTLPTQPSPLGTGQHKQKSVFFNQRHFAGAPGAQPQAGSVAASSLPGIGAVHGQGLPSSLPERAADTYTGQNLFPNTSFISFSHEIFLSEYSLHLENRREVFFIRHIRL